MEEIMDKLNSVIFGKSRVTKLVLNDGTIFLTGTVIYANDGVDGEIIAVDEEQEVHFLMTHIEELEIAL